MIKNGQTKLLSNLKYVTLQVADYYLTGITGYLYRTSTTVRTKNN